MCVCECQGPWIPAEDIDLLELELLVIARLWTLGTEFRSSARGVSDLKHKAISPGSES